MIYSKELTIMSNKTKPATKHLPYAHITINTGSTWKCAWCGKKHIENKLPETFINQHVICSLCNSLHKAEVK